MAAVTSANSRRSSKLGEHPREQLLHRVMPAKRTWMKGTSRDDSRTRRRRRGRGKCDACKMSTTRKPRRGRRCQVTFGVAAFVRPAGGSRGEDSARGRARAAEDTFSLSTSGVAEALTLILTWYLPYLVLFSFLYIPTTCVWRLGLTPAAEAACTGCLASMLTLPTR